MGMRRSSLSIRVVLSGFSMSNLQSNQANQNKTSTNSTLPNVEQIFALSLLAGLSFAGFAAMKSRIPEVEAGRPVIRTGDDPQRPAGMIPSKKRP